MTRCSTGWPAKYCETRLAITRAISAGVSSSVAGSSQSPCLRCAAPFALVVELADDARAHVVAPVVELFLQLVFEDLALLLDDQDFLEALGELRARLRLERPGMPTLNRRMPMSRGRRFVDAEVVERLAHVEVGLAGGDDAEARRSGESMTMRFELVGARSRRARRRSCSRASALPARATASGQRMFRPPGGSAKSSGMTISHAVRIDVDRGADDSTCRSTHLKPTQQPE